ncbi:MULTISPECIES: nucleotidyltransferase domain-containing protein [unclassified Nitratiruptor]|uniref:nucleotidyltransferase domain-containing protein n=1 Tax=unclassified Nitratiruptor TaxID=2624044 RepID=UPI001916762C|nr:MULTISPECIES: nucleotidyltransferase domain-containing protein [unclassified Nitratiruptor]
MNKIVKQIVQRLQKDTVLIILFGSYATNTQHSHSDIDLYIVTNDKQFPTTWQEKSKIYLQVAKKVSDLQKIVPIDLIVHTQPMYKKFVELQSSFSKKILNEGIVLWDKMSLRNG